MRLEGVEIDVALTMQVLLNVVRGGEGARGLDTRESEIEVTLSLRELERRVLIKQDDVSEYPLSSGSDMTYEGRVLGEHDGRCGVVGAARETLPELLGNERHEGVQETKTMIETRVERLLGGPACRLRGGLIGHGLHRFLQRRHRVRSLAGSRRRGSQLTM